MTMHRVGATVIVMEHFDPVEALRLIDAHKVTMAQFVPTMFVRMRKLPEADRRAFDVSSMRAAIHAAAPCPIPVKEQMIAWWGPINQEYYAAMQGNGFCAITTEEWVRRKGSVGRSRTVGLKLSGTNDARVPARPEATVY